jgi:hypothetical protein
VAFHRLLFSLFSSTGGGGCCCSIQADVSQRVREDIDVHRRYLVGRVVSVRESPSLNLLPVLGERLADDGADVAKLLAELGRDLRVVWALEHP